MAQRRKQVLFVDDDEPFLALLREQLAGQAAGAWEIFTAPDAGRALAILAEQRIDLLVLDLHMPVIDGLQFLGLLRRTYPDLLRVVLTSDPSETSRAACLNAGAALCLQKPLSPQDWHSLYTSLDQLARFQPTDGFRGVLRAVGLHDVLQIECLGRNSSVLEITAGEFVGHIFIRHGQIIHADAGQRSGEEAFYLLLGLKGGEFNLEPFFEPPQRTISASWEFLLMEAARQRDESSASPVLSGPEFTVLASAPTAQDTTAQSLELGPRNSEPAAASAAPLQQPQAQMPGAQGLEEGEPKRRGRCALPAHSKPERPAASPTTPPGATLHGPEAERAPVPPPPVGAQEASLRPQIDEMLIASSLGSVLYEWQCPQAGERIQFLEFVCERARQLAQGLPLGRFDRLEAEAGPVRVVTQVQAERTLFLRRSLKPVGPGG